MAGVDEGNSRALRTYPTNHLISDISKGNTAFEMHLICSSWVIYLHVLRAQVKWLWVFGQSHENMANRVDSP